MNFGVEDESRSDFSSGKVLRKHLLISINSAEKHFRHQAETAWWEASARSKHFHVNLWRNDWRRAPTINLSALISKKSAIQLASGLATRRTMDAPRHRKRRNKAQEP
jgi:hypothetical protein